MTWLTDIDGTPFKHDEWVRYSMARTTAAVLAVHAGLLAAVGLYYAAEVPDGWLYAVAFITGYGAVYWVLISKAWDEWDRAKRIRQFAETRARTAPVFMTILATTILKALQAAVEGADEE